MANLGDVLIRDQLLERRGKLQNAISRSGDDYFTDLLKEVDSALERMNAGSYGLCDTCHDPIEQDRLAVDPLMRFCIDHLTSRQREALQHDLDLASAIQDALLPKRVLALKGWSIAYHYEPAGPVSGDYCDIVEGENGAGATSFLVGDISGKGVAASLLMSQLQAIFRTLLRSGGSLVQAMEQANRIFCESTMPGHYATLACGRLSDSGAVELCNAGHCMPVHVSGGAASTIPATSLPLGLFCKGVFVATNIQLNPGDSLVLYTDGLSEAETSAGAEYGAERVADLALRGIGASPEALVKAYIEDLRRFKAGEPTADDVTVMVLQRV